VIKLLETFGIIVDEENLAINGEEAVKKVKSF